LPNYTPPTFLDGDAFDPGVWRSALYDTTPGLSALETTNGHIDGVNLSGLSVQTRHVQPWQVSQGAGAGSVRPIDLFDDAWGPGVTKWYGVAGLGLRFYSRADRSVAHFHASLFGSVWRLRGPAISDGLWASPPKVLVRMFLDGAAIQHTQRGFPETIFLEDGSSYGGSQDYSFAREERNTRHFSLVHAAAIDRGWHHFGVEAFMEAQSGAEEMNIEGTEGPPKADYRRQHRLRLYARQLCWFGVL
jgi:hypothetical protein